jgi:predicted molibdopterin-dependent oxidoreductase YjgC
MFAGVTYERLEGYKSLQWPVAADGTDQPLLYTKRFAFPDGKAKLFPLKVSTPTDPPDEEFDLHLNNGRLLEHFHEGNLTYRVNGSARKCRTPLSKSRPNSPRSGASKAAPGCSSSRVTARSASARW